MANYQQGNYDFVVNSVYQPFTMQEMLVPFTMYKDAYDKAEQEYIDRQDKIDKYSFLNNYGDSSPAKQLYQDYVNEYNKSFNDFTSNGLTLGNKRSWLNIRRKYQKNIGRLEDADKAMQDEIARRQTLDANDPTRIYAKDTVNLSIDDYLDRKKPNDYSVSGNALYKRGAEIGASASSRIYSDPRVDDLTKYYQDFVQTVGYSPELLAEFSQRLDAIPEFQRAVESTLKEYGVTDNLTGNNYQRARQSVINGIINGSVYKRTDNPQRNPDVMDAYQTAQIGLSTESLNLEKQKFNWQKSKEQQALDIAKTKAENSGNSHASASYDNRNADTVIIGGNSGKYYRWSNDDTANHSGYTPLEGTSPVVVDPATLVDATGAISNDKVRNAIGNANLGDYEISVIPKGTTKVDGSGWFSDDDTDEDIYIIKPRVPKRSATNNQSQGSADTGNNDIPQ